MEKIHSQKSKKTIKVQIPNFPCWRLRRGQSLVGIAISKGREACSKSWWFLIGNFQPPQKDGIYSATWRKGNSNELKKETFTSFGKTLKPKICPRNIFLGIFGYHKGEIFNFPPPPSFRNNSSDPHSVLLVSFHDPWLSFISPTCYVALQLG